MGLEPTTYGLQNRCSTIELHRREIGRRDWVRTSDFLTPNQAHYQAVLLSVVKLAPVPGFEPGVGFPGGLTVRCLANWAHTGMRWFRWRDLNPQLAD